MSQKLDFYIDTGANTLVAAGSAINGSLPTLTRNDVYTWRIRLQERDGAGFLRDLNLTSPALKLGLGDVNAVPSDGQFRLTLSATTSSAITYNASALEVYNAISAIAGTGVTVAAYGSESSAWIITAATVNTALSLGADTFTLFPASAAIINTRRAPAASVKAQQIVKIRRNPAVYADTWSSASTANVVTLTKVQDGGTNLNETYRLTVGADAEGGSLVLAYGANSTTAVPIGSPAVCFSEALSAVTGIGAGNISVESANNLGEYTISFVRALGQANITTGLTLDASGVRYARFYQATVTMATAELDELFAAAGSATITPTLEVELTTSGSPRTVYQGSVTVRADLITAGAAVPAGLASYYTKAEADAKFVEDTATGAYGTINADEKILASSNNSYAVDWENRILGDSNENLSVDWGGRYTYDTLNGCVAFAWDDDHYVQDSSGNMSAEFSSRRLFTASATVVLDWSKMATTAPSLNFGSVAANASATVTVSLTGATTNGIVWLGVPNSTCAGLIFQGAVSGANVVKITAFNVTGSAVTQSAQTFRITTLGY